MAHHANTPQSVLDAPQQSSVYQRRILFALNRTGQHIYAGTVPANVKAHRRAAGKAARKSRRANRGG